jgi:mono/diheme cytochrome c family protein
MPAVIGQVGATVGAMVVIGMIGFSCAPESSHAELRTGRGVYADNCSTCHGNRGQGGVGPALADVRKVWPSCADQQDWIALGTERWQAERGPVYGADDTPITKVMPSHADRLTPEEIAAVAAFQRVEYGGGDPASELAACGLTSD